MSIIAGASQPKEAESYDIVPLIEDDNLTEDIQLDEEDSPLLINGP
jgi:hypothetical protein